jgi:hypothetical protein
MQFFISSKKFMRPLIFLLSISFCNFCYGQAYDKNSTDSTIIKNISSLTGRFIIQKPLKNDNSLYFDTMDIKEIVTTKQFIEMQNKYPFLKNGDFKMNKISIDTTLWLDAELKGKILIEDYNADLDYKDLLKKYNLQKDKKLRDTIWNYNNDNCFKRKIVTRISKPIFNTSKTVCTVEVSKNDICGEGRRDITYLFYKDNNGWKSFEVSFGRAVKY